MEIIQNQLESTARLQNVLRLAGIESVVIGGIAVAVWGKPRATKVADLKVLLSREQADELLAALPADNQPTSDNPKEDLQRFGFVFTNDSNGVRIDLLLADFGFDEVAIKRGLTLEPVPGLKLTLCTPEDLIIYKLISTRAYDHEDARRAAPRRVTARQKAESPIRRRLATPI